MNRIEHLELDIDLRLLDLWREAELVEEWTPAVVAPFLRAAYGAGYVHALTEPDPGHLATENGYTLPRMRAA